ncbi:PREDICTED: probable ubiquitin-like-specific protease 2B isoform X1 [Erythranthe guttata]|uniref:probable ubiquitin-like-specific protease 2B isoform X1 n=1 Tax=Erythranthe guttata TaxID=4155 RepID=UPI00064DEB48|nr:PREDICTED: probable ubiquitin-like-specific protease 2B isoform X1 [Erythranthe guttata]|eukprot:XP_012838859.1 PREDICTED: probable ubiquitin-like-specific protease 2B isoform X1 [Erythranthe guttata]
MRFSMTETERMKSLSKSFDVFEFKEEGELTQMAAKKYSPKSGYHHSVDGKVSGINILSKKNDTGMFGGKDTEDIDYNNDAAGSITPSETEDFAEETPELTDVQLNVCRSSEKAKEMKSNVTESGSVFSSVECGSSPGATVRLEEHSNCAFPESSCYDKSVDLASDADDSMSERSPSATANKASSDGPSSDVCFSDWNFGDERMGIVFDTDYVNYCGIHYLDSVMRFSRSSIEARSKTSDGNEENFHIHLEIDDIVRIESQWSARFEAGTIHIYFISKEAVQKDGIVQSASGLQVQELKFPAIDSNWYKKQEAIESLDVRYKALWNVLLDTGMDNSSDLPDGEAMMLKRSYFPKFDKPFEEVIYPKGDPDAVSISKRDVDLLLPDTFVNDTIIDFYIKYLKTRQHVKERTDFHFFNSFFFRKLADMDKDPSSAFDGKAAFQRVRKWTRKVNLLEKDFVFIPVNYNYHWSLIVICYFGEVASYKEVEDGKSERVPCILHMDSLRGNHVGLKDLIQSYLWEEWKERQKGTCEDLYSKFRNLKFVPLELPQQQNSYDCGLFLLHYVELFVEEVPTNFSIYKITSSAKFLQADWFPPGEASMKRSHIERLINGLLDTQSEVPNTTDVHQSGVDLSVKPGPLSYCLENSPCHTGQGIEMTLLPASSIENTRCTKTSGLIFNDLYKQPSTSEPFNDTPWEALESRPSLNEFTTPVHLTEDDEAEANECFEQTQLAEPIFHYSTEDFRLDLLHQSQDANSSPVSSGCESGDILKIVNGEKWESVEEAVSLDSETCKRKCTSSENVTDISFAFPSGQVVANADESRNLDEITDQIDDSLLLKNSPDLCREENPLHDKSDGPECESLYRMDGQDVLQRTAKRMRIVSPDDGGEGLNGNLSEELHL